MGEEEGGSMMPPGFRFHPTDEELVVHYLKPKAASCPIPVSIITDIDLYKFNPWDLPAKANFGEKEWYFFSPRDRKYPNGARPNRAAGCGYWKATGTDKVVVTRNDSFKVGVKKALVFYKGKPPKGIKTDWIMHEYRLTDVAAAAAAAAPKLIPSSTASCFVKKSLRLDDWVLCRIYKKAQAPKVEHECSSSPNPHSLEEMAPSSMMKAPPLEEMVPSSSYMVDPNNNNHNNYYNNINKHADVLPRMGSFGALLADADLYFTDNLMSMSSALNTDVTVSQQPQQQHVFSLSGKPQGLALPPSYVPKLENEEADLAYYFSSGAGKRGGGAGSLLPGLEGPLFKKNSNNNNNSSNNNNNSNNGILLPQFSIPSFYPDANSRTWPFLPADSKSRF